MFSDVYAVIIFHMISAQRGCPNPTETEVENNWKDLLIAVSLVLITIHMDSVSPENPTFCLAPQASS